MNSDKEKRTHWRMPQMKPLHGQGEGLLHQRGLHDLQSGLWQGQKSMISVVWPQVWVWQSVISTHILARGCGCAFGVVVLAC